MPNQLTLKTFAGFEIKDVEKGEVEAVVATVGVIDLDGDIIRKEAVPKDAKAAMSDYGHSLVFGKRPVGKGRLVVENGALKFKGRVFLNTVDGRESFETLKEMGSDQEWSFGFYTLGSEVPNEEQRKQGAVRIITKMDPFEVSPVFRGAGIDTRTVAVKQADGDGGMDDATLTRLADAVAIKLAARVPSTEATETPAEVMAPVIAEDPEPTAPVALPPDDPAIHALHAKFLGIADRHAEPTPEKIFERFQRTRRIGAA